MLKHTVSVLVECEGEQHHFNVHVYEHPATENTGVGYSYPGGKIRLSKFAALADGLDHLQAQGYSVLVVDLYGQLDIKNWADTQSH